MDDPARILWLLQPLEALIVGLVATSGVAAAMIVRRAGLAWEAALQASCEVGVLVASLVLVVDGLLTHATVGRAWSWDPLLATAAALVLSWVGVLMLRSSVRDPERRAVWSGIVTLVALANLPLTLGAIVHWRALDAGLVARPVLASPGAGGLAGHGVVLLVVVATLWWSSWRIALRQAVQALPDALPET